MLDIKTKRAFTTNEAAHYLGVSTSLLKQARSNSPSAKKLDAPKSTKLGRRKVVYCLEDLNDWLDSHKSI